MVKFLGYAGAYMPLLTILVFILLRKSVWQKNKLLLFYAVASLLLYCSISMISGGDANGIVLYNISVLAELILASSYILKTILRNSFSFQFIFIAGCYFIFWLYSILFPDAYDDVNSTLTMVSNLVLLFLSMYYLLNLSAGEEILYFQRVPSFWVISGFLIYAALRILVFISYKYINSITPIIEQDQVYTMNSIATVIEYSLICTGLVCNKRNTLPSGYLSILLM